MLETHSVSIDQFVFLLRLTGCINEGCPLLWMVSMQNYHMAWGKKLGDDSIMFDVSKYYFLSQVNIEVIDNSINGDKLKKR